MNGKISPALKCRNLVANYEQGSQHPVLTNVNIDVKRQEIVGLLGPNGSGKSSLLKTIHGHLRIVKGTIYINGKEVTRLSPESIVQEGVRYFPQGGHIFTELTVNENLDVIASCVPRGFTIDKSLVYKWFPDLLPRSGTRSGLLSGGQRQMLSLGMILLFMQLDQPQVFLLDEPSGGLDPTNRKRLTDILLVARNQYEAAILLAEENAVFAKEVCERFYHFIEPGHIESI